MYTEMLDCGLAFNLVGMFFSGRAVVVMKYMSWLHRLLSDHSDARGAVSGVSRPLLLEMGSTLCVVCIW